MRDPGASGFGDQLRIRRRVHEFLHVGSVGRLDYLHRDLAGIVVIAITLLTLWMLSRRSPLVPWAFAALGLALLQIAFGVVMAYISLAPAAQVGHLTIASLLLGAETVLWLLSRRQV